MSSANPIFIIGNPRSGTTLLRLMLTCHQQICIPPEAGFAMWLEPQFGDWCWPDQRLTAFLDALFASRKFETWQLQRQTVQDVIEATTPQDYATLVSTVYSCYANTRKSTWARWGDKNNFYIELIPRIHALFPGAQFVHIVRDPRDVACSYLEIPQSDSDYVPRLPQNITEIAHSWRDNIERVETDLAAIDQASSCRLRYEDLVSDPVVSLQMLCEFLDIPFDSGMLDYHETNQRDKLEPTDFLEWKQLTLSPPQASRIGRYRQDLEPRQATIIARQAEPAFSRYYS